MIEGYFRINNLSDTHIRVEDYGIVRRDLWPASTFLAGFTLLGVLAASLSGRFHSVLRSSLVVYWIHHTLAGLF